MWINYGLLILGIIMLFWGGDTLINSSIRIANHFKISPFVLGATIIGFGTSSPELAVSIFASMKDAPEVALGNALGSNIANICLVLGLTSLFGTITISKKTFKSETPLLLISTIIIVFLSWDHKVSRLEGSFLLLCMLGYLWLNFLKKEEVEGSLQKNSSLGISKIRLHIFLIIMGLFLLLTGANCLVKGAVNIAQNFGISEWLIGITIVALGTSLPEIVSTLFASFRGQPEMSFGNIYGSNIFNINLVVGSASVINPLNMTEHIRIDLMILLFFTFLLVILLRPKLKLVPLHGFILIICYISYLSLKSLNFI